MTDTKEELQSDRADAFRETVERFVWAYSNLDTDTRAAILQRHADLMVDRGSKRLDDVVTRTPERAFYEAMNRPIREHDNISIAVRALVLLEFVDELRKPDSRFDDIEEHVKHVLDVCGEYSDMEE